jgi:hypothetical protein
MLYTLAVTSNALHYERYRGRRSNILLMTVLRLHSLWNVIILPAAADRVRPIPEILAIASRRFRVLINRNQDRFDVVVTPTFMHSHVPDLG